MENPRYRLHDKKSLYFVCGSILSMFMVSVIAVDSLGHASSGAYDLGYDHGCADAGVSDPEDRYINQPGKGPAFHSNRFMEGYNYGFAACSDNVMRT